MSDPEVAQALRSNAPLVLIEAPAGFGKTFQGAAYAKDLLPGLFPGRLLVLTHTNAACDVFADRTNGFGGRVEIRTIDSLIKQIATPYHKALGLPSDIPTWAHQQGPTGFNQVAMKVASLLAHSPAISASLALRYPYLVCDEHQDSSEAQHQIILSLYCAGALTRVFGDPMQAIYRRREDRDDWNRRWIELQNAARKRVVLDTPHRWKDCAPELGDWISEARRCLKAGREINLRAKLPRGLTLVLADNNAQRHGQYILGKDERRPIDSFVRAASELLILTSTNETVRGLRAFFNRSIPIWEGHTRDALFELTFSCRQHKGNAVVIGNAFIKFVQTVSRGFTETRYGGALRREIAQGCSAPRTGKLAQIQNLARLIADFPDHQGVARALARLEEFMSTDNAVGDIKLDLRREFKEAVRLAEYEDADVGMAELNRRRSVFRPSLPAKVISTVHKAKGLERESVLVVPCDQQHFATSDEKRSLLYVALSRATKLLALVLPRRSPSLLFRL